MPIILIVVVILIVAVYLFIRSSDKFTRGGDINRQGEEMDRTSMFDSDNNGTNDESNDDAPKGE